MLKGVVRTSSFLELDQTCAQHVFTIPLVSVIVSAFGVGMDAAFKLLGWTHKIFFVRAWLLTVRRRHAGVAPDNLIFEVSSGFT